MLSMYHQDEYVQNCLSLGVEGYMVKSDHSAGIVEAIETVRAGNTYLSPLAQKTAINIIKTINKEPEIIFTS